MVIELCKILIPAYIDLCPCGGKLFVPHPFVFEGGGYFFFGESFVNNCPQIFKHQVGKRLVVGIVFADRIFAFEDAFFEHLQFVVGGFWVGFIIWFFTKVCFNLFGCFRVTEIEEGESLHFCIFEDAVLYFQ